MDRKYSVPSIERAHHILTLLAKEPGCLKLIDLSKRLEINKSSMYSLLLTMESLGWVTKEKGDTYSLGSTLGVLSASYFHQFNLLQSFHSEAPLTVQHVGEGVQLAMLDGADVVYLAKEENGSPYRLVSNPGMRFSAYATALGKIQLSQKSKEELDTLYPTETLEPKTPFTLKSVTELYRQLEIIRKQQYASEMQEAVEGFCCVAAPVYNHANQLIAGVSISMNTSSWEAKMSIAKEEIIMLGKRLSQLAGNQNYHL